MSLNFWLTAEQFNKIKPLLPSKSRGVPRVDDRRVLSGIIFCLQRGYRWSDVPALNMVLPKRSIIVTNAGPRSAFLNTFSIRSHAMRLIYRR